MCTYHFFFQNMGYDVGPNQVQKCVEHFNLHSISEKWHCTRIIITLFPKYAVNYVLVLVYCKS